MRFIWIAIAALVLVVIALAVAVTPLGTITGRLPRGIYVATYPSLHKWIG